MSDMFDIDFDCKQHGPRTAQIEISFCQGVNIQWEKWVKKSKFDFDDAYLEIFFDDVAIFQGFPSEQIQTISHDFDDDSVHTLTFSMPDLDLTKHTAVIDGQEHRIGILISSIIIEQIPLTNILLQRSKWQNTQGTTPFPNPISDRGQGIMEIGHPLYAWLLEQHNDIY